LVVFVLCFSVDRFIFLEFVDAPTTFICNRRYVLVRHIKIINSTVIFLRSSLINSTVVCSDEGLHGGKIIYFLEKICHKMLFRDVFTKPFLKFEVF
jgi:hypothetical protein